MEILFWLGGLAPFPSGSLLKVSLQGLGYTLPVPTVGTLFVPKTVGA